MKLQSMVSFVLSVVSKPKEAADEIDILNWRSNDLKEIESYAKFLSQPLHIGMFISCGEDGLPMLEPKPSDYFDVHIPIDQYDDSKGLDKYYSALIFWESAVDRVLFEGCSVIKFPDHWLVLHKEEEPLWVSWNKSKTIESLIDRGLTLTPTAVKQLKYKIMKDYKVVCKVDKGNGIEHIELFIKNCPDSDEAELDAKHHCIACGWTFYGVTDYKKL